MRGVKVVWVTISAAKRRPEPADIAWEPVGSFLILVLVSTNLSQESRLFDVLQGDVSHEAFPLVVNSSFLPTISAQRITAIVRRRQVFPFGGPYCFMSREILHVEEKSGISQTVCFRPAIRICNHLRYLGVREMTSHGLPKYLG